MRIILNFKIIIICLFLIGTIFCAKKIEEANLPDTILYNGKIITVDKNFSIAEAVAIKKDRIIAVGTNSEIKRLAGGLTKKIDLKGKAVIPGLIDAHAHPETAAISELFEQIPNAHNIAELLEWIKKTAEKKKPGEWIIYPKFFPTRLAEMRQPTRKELDNVAPQNPVLLDGSFAAMMNSSALKILGITKQTNRKGVLKDPTTGEPTGYVQEFAFVSGEPKGYIIESVFKILKKPPSKPLTYEVKLDALVNMIKRYNEVGITSFCSGIDEPELIKMYMDLWKSGRLTARVYQNILVWFDFKKMSEREIKEKLVNYGYYTGFGNEWFKIGALKTINDAGILSGTAYQRVPWGIKAKELFGVTDPNYRGFLYYTKEELIPLIKVANEIGWKYTAHCTGGGTVDILLSAFEEVNKEKPIKDRRFSIIHGNFYTPEAIEKMKTLGVYADAQPAWFYKDADAMKYIFGDEVIKTFHPYESWFDAGVIVNGGSDHMVKFDSYSSINPYNPFLAMWTVITRKTERGNVILLEEAITRGQALKMYTINNAYGSFEEDIKGSIEPGKLADLVIVSDDILTCPVDKIKDITVKMTMVGGKVVYCSELF